MLARDMFQGLIRATRTVCHCVCTMQWGRVCFLKVGFLRQGEGGGDAALDEMDRGEDGAPGAPPTVPPTLFLPRLPFLFPPFSSIPSPFPPSSPSLLPPSPPPPPFLLLSPPHPLPSLLP